MSKLRQEATGLMRRPICSNCLLRLSRTQRPSMRWNSTAARPSATETRPRRLDDYFFANDAFLAYTQKGLRVLGNGIWSHNGLRRPAAGSAVTAPARAHTSRVLRRNTTHAAVLPHSPAREAASTEPASIESAEPSSDEAHTLPPDASSRLSTRAAKLPASSGRRLLATWLSLSKPRLTFLMVLTTASAYSLYPAPELLSATATASPSLSALTLVWLTTGTTLCSASANALNMLMEPAHDAKMSRTRNRPLVRGLIGRRGALAFAACCGAAGAAGLYWGVNPTVAFLGAFNIFLYAGVYTPLKRISVANTWVGALVGAIPPLMGWAAAAGQAAAADGGWRELLLGADNAGGWLLAGLLFAWQFPHFNALSWTIREEYRAAGYRMMAWVDPARNGRVALRYALAFFPLCAGLAAVGVTDPAFVLSSSALNLWIAREAVRFWRLQGRRGSARALFWAGVWQLPGLMVLAMLHKKGLWHGLWSRFRPDPDGDDVVVV